MAKAAWCTVAPITGNGNKSIAITATAHTGRTARSTTVTVQNQSGTKPSKAIAVSQAAKAAFFSCVGKTVDLPAAGGIFSIAGTSNAKAIQFSDNDGYFDEIKIKINSALDTSWNPDIGTLSGDPGANTQYTFEITGRVLNNVLAGVMQCSAGIAAYNDNVQVGSTTELICRVAGAASALSIDKTTVSIVEAGTAQNVAITSNDGWTVS